MTPRKSHRVHKPRKIREQKGAPSAAKDPKITKKISRTVEKTALKPIATRPLPKAVGFDANNEAFQLQTMLLANQEAQNYQWAEFPKRGYCVWCKEHAEKWTPKRGPVLAEIVNGAVPAKCQRQSKTYGGCIGCNAYLCRK
jgi:cell division septation protein DedD